MIKTKIFSIENIRPERPIKRNKKWNWRWGRIDLSALKRTCLSTISLRKSALDMMVSRYWWELFLLLLSFIHLPFQRNELIEFLEPNLKTRKCQRVKRILRKVYFWIAYSLIGLPYIEWNKVKEMNILFVTTIRRLNHTFHRWQNVPKTENEVEFHFEFFCLSLKTFPFLWLLRNKLSTPKKVFTNFSIKFVKKSAD